MSTSRLLSLFVVVVFVVMAIFAVRPGAATSHVTSVLDQQDRLPGFINPSLTADAQARLEYRRGEWYAGEAAVALDQRERHPASAIPADIGASDWFERHPESLKAGNAADRSDYYQRHLVARPQALEPPAPPRTAVLEQGSRFDRVQPIARPETSNRTMVLEQGNRYDRAQASASR